MLRYIATILRLFRAFILKRCSIKNLSYMDLFFICLYDQVVSDTDVLLWVTKWLIHIFCIILEFLKQNSVMMNKWCHASFYVYVFPVCMSILHVCVIWGHPEGNGSLETGVTHSCESLCRCWILWKTK